jgi:hypothetical protein
VIIVPRHPERQCLSAAGNGFQNLKQQKKIAPRQGERNTPYRLKEPEFAE